MRLWLGFVFGLLVSAALAEPGEFVTNATFDSGPLKIRLINYEVPRNKPYLIVHFDIANPTSDDHRCDWASLVRLQSSDGTSMSPNYDVMVDSGTGGTRATGPFLVPRGKKARAAVLFVLSANDLPGRLVLPDGRRSPPIDFRGKVVF